MKLSFKSQAFPFLLIIFASEVIYTLPFHLPRFFRSEFLECFGFCHEELSEAQAWYGLMSLLCYFPGGFLSTVFAPLPLMVVSLLLSAFSGGALFFAPGVFTLKVLYAFWGASSSLLFWSSLIAYVRSLGDPANQGKAFGSLEFGRGAFAAILVTFLNFSLGEWNPFLGTYPGLSFTEVKLYGIVLFYIVLNFLGAGFCFFLMRREPTVSRESEVSISYDWRRLASVCGNKGVWLNLVVLICAYCAFKGLDYYAWMLKEHFHLSSSSLLLFVTLLAWGRPFSAVLMGPLGDLLKPSKACFICFLMILFPTLSLIYFKPHDLGLFLFFSLIVIQLMGIFGLRGVYFALFEEARVKQEDTALATGFISFLGFTPEFFLPLIAIALVSEGGGGESFLSFIFIVSVLGAIAAGGFFQKSLS